VASGAELFFVDQLTSGRVGHGEAWQWNRLCLDLTVRIAGELALRERLDQTGPELHALAELAGSGAAACFANAILVRKESAHASETQWRAELTTLHRDGLWLGVSALRRGGWSIKLIAPDAVRLREGLRAMRRILSRYFPRLGCDPRKL
jgi:urease accessory protein